MQMGRDSQGFIWEEQKEENKPSQTLTCLAAQRHLEEEEDKQQGAAL